MTTVKARRSLPRGIFDTSHLGQQLQSGLSSSLVVRKLDPLLVTTTFVILLNVEKAARHTPTRGTG